MDEGCADMSETGVEDEWGGDGIDCGVNSDGGKGSDGGKSEGMLLCVVKVGLIFSSLTCFLRFSSLSSGVRQWSDKNEFDGKII